MAIFRTEVYKHNGGTKTVLVGAGPETMTIPEETSTYRDSKKAIVTFTQKPDPAVSKGIGSDGLVYYIENLDSKHYNIIIANV